MTAEILRRAASLMRARAEAATKGPWKNMRGASGETVVANATVIARMHGQDERQNRRHIASWHPAVALAVADWLDAEAEAPTRCTNCTVSHRPDFHSWKALAVARAYLGEAADA